MKKQLIKRTGSLIALFALAALPLCAATDTVLQLYGTNVMEFTVEDGVWSYEGEFANNTNFYGGKKQTFKGLASDGRRVFIGEQASGSSRILEFDLEGNYQRVLKTVGHDIEHMAMSGDGKWIYANLNAWSSNAAVHRYSAITGTGYSDITDSSGEFIPNKGTNALGAVLWEFHIHRGVTADDMGNLWVSDRTADKVFKFRESDGAYLGVVSGLGRVQGLYYNADDKKIYCTSSGDNTYVIDTANMTRTTVNFGPNTNNRLSITKVADDICGSCYDNGVISSFDFDTVTSTTMYAAPIKLVELITLPKDPLRDKIGELLISETASNRVMRISFDTGSAYDVEDEYFAGGAGITYNGTPLRQPRGLVTHSNYVYIAEGVAGGRVLKFSKWGTLKSVALDFSQTAYSNCVPAALAVTPDGASLYVTDAHTLYIDSDGSQWSNVMTDGYLSTNSYGDAVYKVNPMVHSVSVFVDANNLPSDCNLIEPRGIAVDCNGNVYFSSWYNDPDNLYDSHGRLYYYSSAGAMQFTAAASNPSACYYDPLSVYDPPSLDTITPGPGIVTCEWGIQDIFHCSAETALTSKTKVLDNNDWHTYLDLEVINEQVWYTDPVFGKLMRRSGHNKRVEEVNNLATPTYMTFAEVTGDEPPAQGTIILVQ